MNPERLKPDTRLRGIDPAGEVKILHVEALGPDAVTVAYTRASGEAGAGQLWSSTVECCREAGIVGDRLELG